MLTSQPALRKTPLNAEHHQLGARMVPYAGWEMPVQYVGVVREHKMVRSAAGLFDVSHMGRMHLSGAGAVRATDAAIANNLQRLKMGAALYTCCCDDNGMILDDLIVYRLADEEVLVICNAANRSKILSLFMRSDAENCVVRDISDSTALLAVQGPLALEAVQSAGIAPGLASRITRFQVTREYWGAMEATVARTGYTGEDGVEIMVSRDNAVASWQRLLKACQLLGGGAIGLAARDTLRLEACLSLYGNELSEAVHPFEAGLGWTVDLDSADFRGKASLLKLKSQEPTRSLVGFEMLGRGIARAGYPLFAPGGKEIGRCTSGSPAPSLGKSVGLAYVQPHYAALGHLIDVDCRGRKVEAKIVKTPFYRRPRGATKAPGK